MTALKRNFFDDSCVDSVFPSVYGDLNFCHRLDLAQQFSLAVGPSHPVVVPLRVGPSRQGADFLILGLSFLFRIGVFAPLVRWCAGCAWGPVPWAFRMLHVPWRAVSGQTRNVDLDWPSACWDANGNTVGQWGFEE
jgi:hypothetical protein